jgi:hypothetical protein
MTADDELDGQVNQLAVMMLVVGGPTALAPVQGTSRFERMAKELEYAIRHTSAAEMAELVTFLGSDAGAAIIRRVTGIWGLAEKLFGGTVDELSSMVTALRGDRFMDHVARRIGEASFTVTDALQGGARNLSSLARELKGSPAEAGPKLLVLVLSSIAASGGVDGNGGAPDLDIPLMGVGEHRSPFTHSIIIGTALEASLLLLMRLVLCTHKNLPADHDPLWNGIASQSLGILQASGKGASIGIAYHLMVDAVAQPGAYHGIPFDMPIEAHQTILGMNSVAEGASARSYPGDLLDLERTLVIACLHCDGKFRVAAGWPLEVNCPSCRIEFSTKT